MLTGGSREPEEREADVVLDGLETSIERPLGKPDLVVATSVEALFRTRQSGAKLRATFTGPAKHRDAFLAVFDLV